MAGSMNTQKLTNVVDFQVDKTSFDKAKKSLADLKKFSEGIQPSLNMTKAKKDFKQIEQYAENIAKHMKAARAGGSPTPPPAPPRVGGSGGGKGGGSGGGPGRGGSGISRADTAQLRRENFNYRASRFATVDSSRIEQSTRLVEAATKQYENQAISASRMNQILAHELNTLREIDRQNRAIANQQQAETRREERAAKARQLREDRERARQARDQQRESDRRTERRRDRLREYGNGILGLNPGMLAGGLIGAGALAGIGKIRGNLDETADRVNYAGQAARNVEVNPNLLMALTNWGQANGVDSANMTKSVDQVKDVREKLASSVTTSSLNKKGQWAGGNSGVNEIMNQFGWNVADIKKMQHNPVDFLQNVVNAGQAKGMSDGQIGNLLENLGDDLSHFVRAFKNNGAELLQSSRDLVTSGNNLTQEQIDAAHKYTVMGAAMDRIGDGLSNKLLDGFVNQLNPSITAEFQKNLVALGPTVKDLGNFMGATVNKLMAAGNAIDNYVRTTLSPAWNNTTGPKQDLDASGNYYHDSFAGWVLDNSWGGAALKGALGWGGHQGDNAMPLNTAPISDYGDSYKSGSLSRGVAQQQMSVNQAPIINVPPSIVNITMTPTPGFGNLIDAKIEQSQKFSQQYLARSIASSVTN